MYVDVVFNRVQAKALVDKGSFHNFIAIKEAQRFNIKPFKDGGSIKVVKFASKLIEGITHGMKEKIREWSGMLNIFVVQMDDFRVI